MAYIDADVHSIIRVSGRKIQDSYQNL